MKIIDYQQVLLCPMGLLACSLVLGMLLADVLCVSFWIWLSACTVVLLLSLYFGSFRQRHLQSALVLLATALVGAALMQGTKSDTGDGIATQPIRFEAVIASQPVMKKKVMQMDILITSIGNPIKARASIYRDSLSERLCIGNGIVAYAPLAKPANWRPNDKRQIRNDNSFDYRLYLLRHGYRSTVFLYCSDWQPARVSLRSLTSLQRLRLKALMFRQRLVERYNEAGFDGQQLAVLSAMTLGYRANMQQSLTDAYSISGGAHVLALSGLHLTILFMVFTLVFSVRIRPTRFNYIKRMVSTMLLLVAVWSFVVLVGMSPSVVRSAVMLSVFCLLQLIGRRGVSLNTLSFAACCMLCANPMSLFDVGFQLSFASVASIITLYKPLFGLLYSSTSDEEPLLRRLLHALWGFVCVSLSAQIGVMPLIAFYFHRVSCYSLLASFIVVPAAYAVIVCAVLFWLFAWWPWAQSLFVKVLDFAISCLNGAVSWVASLPGASIEHVRLNIIGLVACYVIILSVFSLYRLLHGIHLPKPS